MNFYHLSVVNRFCKNGVNKGGTLTNLENKLVVSCSNNDKSSPNIAIMSEPTSKP